MATYTETKAILDEIATRSEANRKRIEQAKAQISTALADLTAMGSAYSGFATQLNTDAAANPGDGAWQNALAEKDQMLVDFQALKTRATDIDTAISGL